MSQPQNFTFSSEEIESQTQQLRDEGIQVADMVEVTRDEIALVYAYLSKTYDRVVLANGYFDLSAEKDKRCDQATLWFPQAVAFVTENQAVAFVTENKDGSDKTDTLMAIAINSNASVANGPSQTCNYDAKVRAGVLVAETNWPYEVPIVQAVVVYNDNTACNALAVQKELLDGAGLHIAGYSKGANYNPKGGDFTLEHKYTKAQDIPWIVSPVVGTANPTYPQTGDEPELEAALGGKINYDSLQFLVPKELYDQVMATRQER